MGPQAGERRAADDQLTPGFVNGVRTRRRSAPRSERSLRSTARCLGTNSATRCVSRRSCSCSYARDGPLTPTGARTAARAQVLRLGRLQPLASGRREPGAGRERDPQPSRHPPLAADKRARRAAWHEPDWQPDDEQQSGQGTHRDRPQRQHDVRPLGVATRAPEDDRRSAQDEDHCDEGWWTSIVHLCRDSDGPGRAQAGAEEAHDGNGGDGDGA